jgi:ParB-like chromosome segregation protein Spo0J
MQISEKIRLKKTTDLIPFSQNSRVHTTEQIQQICDSIVAFGFTNPILIDDKNEIVAGHARVEAAKKLALEKVPTISVAHLTQEQKRAYVIADNQLALNADWNVELLKSEVAALNEMNFDINLLGLDEEYLPIETDQDDENEKYNQSIDAVVYEPQDEKPEIPKLFDATKAHELIKKIQNADVSEKEKEFLEAAAWRHTVLDFQNIAEYYAHADAEMQTLMEDSALVIIDFDQAIEKGYVRLSEEISKQYSERHGDLNG